MKRLLAIAITASLGLIPVSAAAQISIGDYAPGDAARGIGQSRHNLGSLGMHTIASATSQICVFCHTPHHTNTAAQPLWNRSTANSTSYTAYGSTVAGTSVANSDLYGATLACLSCHDGVTAFDNLVNRPGKDTAAGDLGWTFTRDGSAASDFIPGSSGRLIIGPDLSNDHPVSVAYSADVASLRPRGVNIASIDLSSNFSGTNANVMQNLWAVKGFFDTDATIDDLLRDNPNVPGGRAVECASCHDPHFSNKSYDEVESTWGPPPSAGPPPPAPPHVTPGEDEPDGLFLRRVGGNQASGLCRTCHNK